VKVTDKDREAGWAAMRAADHAHGLDAKAECYAQAIAQAREEEREACAELAAIASRPEPRMDGSTVYMNPGARKLELAIRARGEA